MELIKFIDDEEIIFLQESCTLFYNIIPKDRIRFPSNDIIFSSVKILEWAIKHEFRVNEIRMFRIARNRDVLDFLYYRYHGSRFLTSKIFNEAVYEENIEFLQWLYDKNCDYIKESIEENYLFVENREVKRWIKKYLFCRRKNKSKKMNSHLKMVLYI